MKTQLLLAVALSIAISDVASAGRASSSFGDVTAITESETSAGRYLFRAPIDIEGAVAVRRAYVEIPGLSELSERNVSIRVHPVTQAWSRGATWGSFSRAGGTFDENLYGTASLAQAERGNLLVDVTVILKEILEYDAADMGFILTVDPAAGLGFTSEEMSRLSGLTGAKLVVEYRSIPQSRVERARERSRG